MIIDKLKKQLNGASIRTVLFSILLIIGGWGLLASLYQIKDSFSSYQQDQNLSEWSRVATKLLTAAQHLAYERGRTAVVMRGLEPVTRQDREFISNRRGLADESLQAALESAVNTPEFKTVEISAKWEKVKRIRHQIDQNIILSRSSRNQELYAQWLDAANDLIRSIQSSTLMLISHFNPKEKATRLSLLAATSLELRITSGAEAFAIAELLSAKEVPNSERLNYIHNMRGREDRLWSEVDRLASYLRIPEVQNRVDEIKKQHLVIYRSLQDQVLSDMSRRNQGTISVEKLTSSSQPTLDGIAGLMTLSTEYALRLADEGMLQARSKLFRHMLWALSLTVLLILSVRYILRRVIMPLEFVDSEINRLGALAPQGCEAGNEVDRLKSSTVALEQSLNARAAAEDELNRTIEELKVTIEEVKTLSGFLPICSSCKKIRDDKGYWEQVESYISKHTDAKFSHSYCPDCAAKAFAEVNRMKMERPQ